MLFHIFTRRANKSVCLWKFDFRCFPKILLDDKVRFSNKTSALMSSLDQNLTNLWINALSCHSDGSSVLSVGAPSLLYGTIDSSFCFLHRRRSSACRATPFGLLCLLLQILPLLFSCSSPPPRGGAIARSESGRCGDLSGFLSSSPPSSSSSPPPSGSSGKLRPCEEPGADERGSMLVWKLQLFCFILNKCCAKTDRHRRIESDWFHPTLKKYSFRFYLKMCQKYFSFKKINAIMHLQSKT